MNTINSFIIVALGLLLAEVSYIIYKMPRAAIRTKRGAMLVDTSVLMDGRILTIAKSGFISDTLVIPRSVVGELQLLADNGDADKRARARFGLDAISELQAMDEVMVEILQDGSRAEEGVDERLLSLAKSNNASLCTIDYNLNKVARVEGVKVLNVNELAQGLRMAHLPGERMMIDLVQKGQESHQAVGYLSDGTMVVVEHANGLVGKNIEIEVIRSLQTAAGKMMFGRRVSDKSQQSPQAPQRAQTQRPSGRAAQKQQLKQSAKATTENKRPAKTRSANHRRGSTARDKEAAFLDLIDQQ